MASVALLALLYLAFLISSFALAHRVGAFIPRPREGVDTRTPKQIAAHRGLIMAIFGVSGGMAASITFLVTSPPQTGLRIGLFLFAVVHAVPVFGGLLWFRVRYGG